MTDMTSWTTGGILTAALLLAACAHTSEDAGAESASVGMQGGAIVLQAAALTDGPGSVLGTMAGKIPNLRVRLNPDDCPEITLRNHSSFSQVANPHVYVDGTRATNTCILDTLRSRDVERVEVYPLGYTTRPGYGTHGPGLILVFMRSND